MVMRIFRIIDLFWGEISLRSVHESKPIGFKFSDLYGGNLCSSDIARHKVIFMSHEDFCDFLCDVLIFANFIRP